MRNSIILSFAAFAVLSACDSSPPEEAEPAAEATLPMPPAGTAITSPMGTSAATPPAGFEKMDIPVAIQGRWGMVPADCEPGRADAKGLLVIGPRRLEFYESVGTLDELEEMDPMRIRGDFDFTGEGMTWDREIVLDVQDAGKTLTRQEYGEDAAPGPFRYTKCA